MGVPIERLIVATNENDILHRALTAGEYRRAAVVQTSAPSMDIQVSSNFERAIFDAHDRDGLAVGALMEQVKSGGFTLPETQLARLRETYVSARVGEGEIAETIARLHAETGEVIDPHTAIGVHAAGQLPGDPAIPMVCLACAHAAKFPDAVEAACGIRPALPTRMADLYEREERVTVLPDDLAEVQAFIRRTRRP
jgi:threonine synthase